MKALKIFSSILLATAAGFAAGLLTAPRSGKSTRRKLLLELLKQKNEIQDKVEESYDELKDAATVQADQIKKTANKRWKSLTHHN
jgi:gas vesicle protein